MATPLLPRKFILEDGTKFTASMPLMALLLNLPDGGLREKMPFIKFVMNEYNLPLVDAKHIVEFYMNVAALDRSLSSLPEAHPARLLMQRMNHVPKACSDATLAA